MTVHFSFRKSQVALCQFKGQASSINGEKVKKAVPKMRPVQVLLMLIQHGANGLNLLEAQHVILLEPLLNPSAEAQAISRIHRVGQDKSTFIHRFIVSTISYAHLFHIRYALKKAQIIIDVR
jgi:E3 ubiquitin-protein ligase SHPRH